MTENNQPVDNETTEIDTPSWDEMRAEGLMVQDGEYDKLGVYVGGDGHLVVMSQDAPGDDPQFLLIHCSKVDALVAKLRNLKPEAEEEQAHMEALYEQAGREYDAAVARGEIQEG